MRKQNFFRWKMIDKADKSKKELIDGFLNMFGIDQGGSPWITKQSIYNPVSYTHLTLPTTPYV